MRPAAALRPCSNHGWSSYYAGMAACRQLGYSNAATGAAAVANAPPGTPIWLHGVYCYDEYTALSNCYYDSLDYSPFDCTHADDVTLTCSNGEPGEQEVVHAWSTGASRLATLRPLARAAIMWHVRSCPKHAACPSYQMSHRHRPLRLLRQGLHSRHSRLLLPQPPKVWAAACRLASLINASTLRSPKLVLPTTVMPVVRVELNRPKPTSASAHPVIFAVPTNPNARCAP